MLMNPHTFAVNGIYKI
uniref:Uncharacterized protein n=1 Tax=Moniliophthora roreri TaxID=221103 RepID=A0A0W0G1M8_MONRR